MILNCNNVLHWTEAGKTPPILPNDPKGLRNTAIWQVDRLPMTHMKGMESQMQFGMFDW